MHNLETPLKQAHYRVVHATTYHYSQGVPLCHNEVHLKPRETARQHGSRYELSIDPRPTREPDEALDYFGNHVQMFTISERHLELQVTSRFDVRLLAAAAVIGQPTPPWEKVRDSLRGGVEHLDALQYVFNSPHVPLSPALAEFAVGSFTPGRPWLEALLDLTARIHRDFVYDPMATTVSTPVATVLEKRRGVCQDFAHLQIGCLRALGIPARYVSGYLLTQPPEGKPRLVGADASHAWLAAYCGPLGWVEVDPTNNVVPSLEHITVAWGRDYSDVCPIHGVFVGGGDHSVTVSVDVQPID